LARKEQAAPEPLPSGANKASVVVSFPDGSRWLMELTPLQPTAQTQMPTLTQVANLATIQTDGSAEVKTAAIDLSPATIENGLEPIQEANADERNDETDSGCESTSAANVEEPAATLNDSEPI
jgi:hypothetical protein